MSIKPPPITADSAAGVIARFLKARGVDRIFTLCGGHIMPIFMRCDAEGIRIIDVRDERAAVYMAHAHRVKMRSTPRALRNRAMTPAALSAVIGGGVMLMIVPWRVCAFVF